MNYSWSAKSPDVEKAQFLSSELKISHFLSKLLINRNIDSYEEAHQFLHPYLEKNDGSLNLPDPFLLKGMEDGVQRIIRAIESSENIAVYGDFDCDGITSTAILYSFLKRVGANVVSYNPERLEEGYGINFNSIKNLALQGVRLIISTDCGISENQVVSESKKIKLVANENVEIVSVDFVITDHHSVPEVVPDAVSIINPKQPGCAYPFKEICAVGVVFNLMMGIRKRLREREYFNGSIDEPNLKRDLDLVAIGTIADSMPLLGVNRILVYNGLKEIPITDKKGLLSLLRNSGKKVSKKEYSVRDVSFQIAPKINAAGRVGRASDAVRLLVEDDQNKIDSLIAILARNNTDRQKKQEEVLKEAMKMGQDIIRDNPNKHSLVLYSKNWHSGVIGIVASKISEEFGRPSVIISIDEDGLGKGSLRTKNGIHLYNVLKGCESHLVQYGGHSGAAGITINSTELDNFDNQFEDSIKNYDYESNSTVDADLEIEFDEIQLSFVDDLKRMEPFGRENPIPVFMTREATVKSIKEFQGKKGHKHLEIIMEQQGAKQRGVWFGFKSHVSIGDRIDVIYKIQRDTYNSDYGIVLIIDDLKPT
ncbi:MAG: single-stranded-DNA-specific exonuclease RecJ [Thermodesulfobacteriota bacterium]|nr:single-stranded-DNA-specific exonuclease RecJ [Thermodesulfobacteriota bacterium]